MTASRAMLARREKRVASARWAFPAQWENLGLWGLMVPLVFLGRWGQLAQVVPRESEERWDPWATTGTRDRRETSEAGASGVEWDRQESQVPTVPLVWTPPVPLAPTVCQSLGAGGPSGGRTARLA